MTHVLKATVMLGAVIALLGCNAPPPPEPVIPELTYSHLTPFRFQVGAREVVNAYQPPLKAPHVEHEAPLAPAKALRRWAEDRLVAAGGPGLVRATIQDAAIVEKPVDVNTDFESSFTTEQIAEVTARVAMQVEIRGADGRRVGVAEAAAQRTRSLPEGLTLMERDVFLFELVEAVMKDFDATMATQINRYLSGVIAARPIPPATAGIRVAASPGGMPWSMPR